VADYSEARRRAYVSVLVALAAAGDYQPSQGAGGVAGCILEPAGMCGPLKW